jgi:hypothetical protein
LWYNKDMLGKRGRRTGLTVRAGQAWLVVMVWTSVSLALGVPAAEYHEPGNRARAQKLNSDGHRAFETALNEAGGDPDKVHALSPDGLYWDAVVADPSYPAAWCDAARTSALLGRSDAALQALANVRHLDSNVDLLARVRGEQEPAQYA